MEVKISKTIKESLIVVIVGIVCNGFISLLFNWIHPTKGEIVKNELVKIDSVNYQLNLIVCNYDDKTANGLVFQINNASLDGYNSNLYLSIENKDKRCIKISNIYPKKNYSINLHLKQNPSSKAEPTVEPLNVDDLKFKYKEIGDLDDGYINLILQVILSSMVYAIFYGITSYAQDKRSKERIEYFDKKNNVFYKEKEKLEKEIETSNKKIEHLDTYVNKNVNSFSKFKLLYNRELRDCRKENDFYKDLIKRLVKERSDDKIDYEALKKIISDELKTYTTKGFKSIDIDTVDVIAEIVKVKYNSTQSIKPILLEDKTFETQK